MNQLHKDLQSQGFVVFALNPGIDDEKVIKDYWKDGGFAFDTITTKRDDPTVKKLGVNMFPTNYLIGKDGKILWRGVGFDENAIGEALRAAGIAKK